MLTSSFCHLPGVGPKTELALWSSGVLSWESALEVKSVWRPHLEESIRRHADRDVGYFTTRLPTSQHWRLFRDFRRSCAFVDIETTGFSPHRHQITTIVLYDGETIRHYVNGQNLEDFINDIQAFSLLVTFNGKCFDLPFIEGYFGVKLPHAQIDLRHVLRGLGIAGGLKNCERRLGLRRESSSIDGFLAVQLWHEYRRSKDRRFLETLLAYNVEDAVNLEALMILAFNLNLKLTPFTDGALAVPSPPSSPYHVDAGAMAKVSRLMW